MFKIKALILAIFLVCPLAHADTFSCSQEICPGSFSGNAGECIIVNGTETGVEFGACSTGAAPSDAQYWTGAANGSLSAEKNLGALSTGLVINTSGTPTAYAGTSCTNQFPRSLNGSGAATCADVALGTDTSGGYAASVSEAGPATTATALAADPTDCSAGSYTTGINASGTAQGCTDATTEIDSAISTHAAVTATHGATGAIVGTTNTQTLTNKRVTERVVTTADDATAVIDVDATDQYQLTAMANATTISTTGTPTAGQKLIIRLKDNGTSRGLTWDGVFRAVGVTLPTATTISKTVYIGCIYNLTDTKWDAVAVALEA